MTDNLFAVEYDITKKSKLKVLYEKNKIYLFVFVFILIILVSSLFYYNKSIENKKILIAENYIQAKIYLESGKTQKASSILKKTILENDPVYSSLSFFMLISQNLVTDNKEISELFEHLLKNNKFDKEIKNLIIYKKTLFTSNYINESEIIEELRPLTSNESIWKPHALHLLGDYFVSKKEYKKAKDFYAQILTIKNLQNNLYDQAQSKLGLIAGK